MLCAKCGEALDAAAQYCRSCGTRVEASAIPGHAAAPVGQLPLERVASGVPIGRRISGGSALVALVLFFMPWANVSCMGQQQGVTGYDLASHGEGLLWTVPVAMLVALAIAARVVLSSRQQQVIGERVTVACGLWAAFAMVATYFSALRDLEQDPVFGQMAAQAIEVRAAGVMALLACLSAAAGPFARAHTRPALVRAGPESRAAARPAGDTRP